MLIALVQALALGLAADASAGDVRVAVATNFVAAARELASEFSRQSGHRVRLSSGATGQLYAQIANGAPYDVFLAADSERPARAIAEGLAVAGSQLTYAVGRLVLISAEATPALDADALTASSGRVAIANPKTAPYGVAAMQVFDALGITLEVTPRIVRGASVTQAFQFVITGNASLGLVARSLMVGHDGDGARWDVPAALHAPIRQDAVLLTDASEPGAAAAFLDYLGSDAAAAVIARHGYERS